MPSKKKPTDVDPPNRSSESLASCLLVGIDWADAEHAYAMRDPNS